MPHFDRGVYEPSDELRVFDGSEDDDDVEGSRLPLLIVLALLVLAMFAGVVWLAYTQGVARGRTETPVLTAQNGPARLAPQNPGGAEQPYKGFKIYEQPAPPDDDVDTSATQAAPTPAAVPAAPSAVQAVPAPVMTPKPALVAPVPAAAPKPEPVKAAAAVPPKPAPVVAAAKPVKSEPVKVAATPAKPVPVPAVPKPEPVKVATAAPIKPASQAPATVARNELPPPASAAAGTATSAPRPLVPATKPVPMTAPAASGAAATVSSGGVVLQIGAYKSQTEADAAWKAYKAKHAALLAGANEDVQQANLGDKGTWYRLRLVGFPSKDVASAMCDRLKADGGGCFLGK